MLCLIPTFHYKKSNILKLEKKKPKPMTPILQHSPAILLNASDRETIPEAGVAGPRRDGQI